MSEYIRRVILEDRIQQSNSINDLAVAILTQLFNWISIARYVLGTEPQSKDEAMPTTCKVRRFRVSSFRTFVEISEPEDENRRGGSCPPNISRDKVGTRMAAEALLGVCHKMKAELIHGKATGHNQQEALVEGHGDQDKVLTESQDEDRAKVLPPFPSISS